MKQPEVEVRDGGREITIYQNDRKGRVIHVVLGKRSGCKITVNCVFPDGKRGTRVLEEK